MSSFKLFFEELLILVEKYEKKQVMIKVESEPDYEFIKIFGEKIDSILRAKTGLNDVSELAYTTAEHHPYWALLYNCSEISKTLLEKWNDKITSEEMNEIKWHIKEIENSCKKLEDTSQ
ncbi:MAG: hypothetical protein MKZ80_02030 [Candidatus Nitrosopelagicus sp.]|nr:hypothetical protein [Candidatus Nitrosopelagicus sp.]